MLVRFLIILLNAYGLCALISLPAYSDQGPSETPISKQSGQRDSILKKSTELERQIVTRQKQALSEKNSASEQYKKGFIDGYNKAVIDLVKSQLMSESSPLVVNASATAIVQNKSENENIKTSFKWLDQSFDHLMLNEWNLAVVAASQAITLNPDSAHGYINRSWAYAEKGLTHNAVEDATKAIEIDPKNALAYNNRGYAYEIVGKNELAIKDFRLSCQLRYQAACETVEQIKRFNVQKNQADIKQLSNESKLKYREGDWLAVEVLTTKILKIDPKNASAYVSRSGARSYLGQLKSALSDSLYAIQLNPELGLAHNSKGRIHEQLGQINQAIHEYQVACKLGVQKSCTEFNRLNVAATSK